MANRLTRLWAMWRGHRPTLAARWLALLALATLFLQSAATIDVGYTLRVSYVFMLAALALGLPAIIEGWRRQPEWIRWSALGVLLVYMSASVFGDQIALASNGRAGQWRDAIYLSDLGVGLCAAGLIAGLWREDELLLPVLALLLGAALAATYAVYQWPAQHFGGPLTDLNNTLDSNGITEGTSQGPGILGVERVRGTFLEPHFLAAYLTSILPLWVALLAGTVGRMRVLAAAFLGASAAAILFTASASSWMIATLGVLLALAVWTIARGLPTISGLVAAMLVVACLLVPAILAFPSALSGATGRTQTELSSTTEFRTETWQAVVSLWSARPVLGFGPGQSSVRVTLERGDPEKGLSSSQGLWAASLIDAGLLGFSAWLLFLGGVLFYAGRAVAQRPTLIRGCLLASLCIALLGSELAGDRLDMRVWALLGLALTLTANGLPPGQHGRPSGNQSAG